MWQERKRVLVAAVCCLPLPARHPPTPFILAQVCPGKHGVQSFTGDELCAQDEHQTQCTAQMGRRDLSYRGDSAEAGDGRRGIYLCKQGLGRSRHQGCNFRHGVQIIVPKI